MTKLVIVESPTKAKTIRNFLPKGYHVEASMGHVRDLPASAGEIPAKYKGESWARLGVNVEDDFDPLYVVPNSKKKVLKQLRAQLKDADELILATDEDREGESIGWHLAEVLKPKVPVQRMVFHEITEEAILEALQHTRTVDENLVRAQETRRILDRLVGYTVSPLLWKKIAPKLSAGRVQSVAVRLLVLRERERRAFVSGAYWDLKASLNKRPDQSDHRFEAQLLSVGGLRVATGRDFDENTGKIPEDKKVLLLDKAASDQLRARITDGKWVVTNIEERTSQRSPAPPFTTSTLQQEANRKMGLSARETMRVAQSLYENGYITYMRTDSVHLSDQAVTAARRRVTELYGQEYLTEKPRVYKTKSKAAQEAHEAIRPAGDQMLPVDSLPLSDRERRLYDLIWKRTVATQMANARLKFTTATIEVEDAVFRASGRNVLFPGFFRAYVEGSDDPEAALENQEAPLPPLVVDEEVDCRELEAIGHETKPPARFTEASLVKALEAAGVGRPSTYATIIDTILNRGYAFKQRRELVPTFTAFAVTELMEGHFEELVDLQFTAFMEQELDEIAAGDLDWLTYLNTFYLGESGLENQVRTKEANIDPRTASGIELSNLSAEVRIGQYGPYVAKETDGDRVTAGLPAELAPADLTDEMAEKLFAEKSEGPRQVATDPETGMAIYLKKGPYGPYVQLGGEDNGNSKSAETTDSKETDEAKTEAAGTKSKASNAKGTKAKGTKAKKPKVKKPKRVSLLRGMNPEDVDEELALKLMGLPRTLGLHPETEKTVRAAVGRFGPYVTHDGLFASVKEPDDVLEIELDRALVLLAEKAAKGGKSSKSVLKDLGEHPTDGGSVQVLDGRYGPYVKYKRTNATLPKDLKPEDVTIEVAVKLIDEKKSKKKTTRKKKS